MSRLTITPRPLAGSVTPPSSKSLAHRALVCAALARGESRIENLSPSQDIQATCNTLRALDIPWHWLDKGTISVVGKGGIYKGEFPVLDCGESGSTLRFFIPIALAVAGGARFCGGGRLMQRPQQPYFQLFEEKGIAYEQTNDALRISGTLKVGEYALRGDVSSQFFSGLLLALPLAGGESRVRATTSLESRDYVSMTAAVMGEFGVRLVEDETSFSLAKGQQYSPAKYRVETDWSQAAFWYAANHLGSAVDIRGLNHSSLQGDKRIADFAQRLSSRGDVQLDVSQCPDLVPALAAMAAVRQGRCEIVGAGRLRLKESDRLDTVTQTLTQMGAQILQREDGLSIHGVQRLQGGVSVECHNDHRIAMMAAVAAIACEQAVTLEGAQCVDKSYPQFWQHYEMLGGKIDGILSR